MVVFSDLSIGQMLAVFGYLWFMMSPVQEIINIQYSWYAANAAIARINGLLLLKPAEQGRPARTTRLRIRRPSGWIWSRSAFPMATAKQCSMRQSVDCARRESGAGGRLRRRQVDLVQALLGSIRCAAGVIRYAGVDVADIGWDTVRENVGVVLAAPGAVQRQRAGKSDPWVANMRMRAVAGAGNRAIEAVHSQLDQGLDSWSARAACAFPAVSASAWRWRGLCWDSPAW
jgi:hypothetical protein